MSRSTRGQQADNPIQLYIRWENGKGGLSVYNTETKEKAEIDKLKFLVLAELKTVTGYKKGKGGIYANEVVHTGEQPLTVKWRDTKEIIAEGKYGDIKPTIASEGAKFATILYIKIEGDDRIARLELKSSASGAWINFKDAKEEYDGKSRPDIDREAIEIVGATELKESGNASWKEPIFEAYEPSEEEDQKAIALDEELREYLKAKGSLWTGQTNAEETEEEEVQQPAVAAEAGDFEGEEDDLPF